MTAAKGENMGEAKERAAVEAAAMKAQQEADAAFKKMIETPLSKEEADRMLADNEIQLAQLRVIRLRKVGELNQIEHQLELATLDRSIIIRRTLNSADPAKSETKPAMGVPVGPSTQPGK